MLVIITVLDKSERRKIERKEESKSVREKEIVRKGSVCFLVYHTKWDIQRWTKHGIFKSQALDRAIKRFQWDIFIISRLYAF